MKSPSAFPSRSAHGQPMAAARALAVGHVTVGRRIALFEKRLGVTLLNRTPEGFAVTSAGEAILRQCTAMETAALDLERSVIAFQQITRR
jgi:DNA-binding transcriptional LysR family regulator